MNSFKPASLSFSLKGFLLRGGNTDEHADGWGMAYYEDDCCHLLLDEHPAASSKMAQWVQREPIRSRNVITHIRKATQGAVAPLNCHPFVRTLWGREWAFAHNGCLKVADLPVSRHFVPLGQTDSERAFCLILDRLYEAFGDVAPEAEVLRQTLGGISREIASLGRFNYLLSNGEELYAHRATELHYLRRAFPFGSASLLDCPMGIDFSQHNNADDRMVIVATKPLTDEAWQPLPVGEVVAFSKGGFLTDH